MFLLDLVSNPIALFSILDVFAAIHIIAFLSLFALYLVGSTVYVILDITEGEDFVKSDLLFLKERPFLWILLTIPIVIFIISCIWLYARGLV